jgi:hypothetical protein
MSLEEACMPMDISNSIALNIIDKLHMTLFEVGKALNRNLIAQLVLCVILDTAAFGVVQLKSDISVSFITLSVSNVFALLMGVILLCMTIIHQGSLLLYRLAVSQHIQKLYTSLGYKRTEKKGDVDVLDLIDYPSLLEVHLGVSVLGKLGCLTALENLVGWIVVVCVFIFAPISEVLVCIKLVILTEGSPSMFLSLLVITIITFAFSIVAFSKLLRAAFVTALKEMFKEALDRKFGKFSEETSNVKLREK